MSRRWVWWTTGGLLLVVLLALGLWRLSSEIPDRLREAEETIREEAARYGLRVSYRNLKFHFLYPHVSMEDLEIHDVRADFRIFRAGEVEVSISPGRLLAGDSPVSRIRLRNFDFHLEDANRPLIDRLREGKRRGTMPDIVLMGGTVRIGPLGPVKRWQAKVPEFRVREVRFLGTRITLRIEEASGEAILPWSGAGSWPFASLEAELFHHEGAFRVRKLRASGPAASLKLSGLIEPERRSGDVDLSGEVDLERWMSSGAPAASWLARFAEKGNLAFSATLEGTPERPGGSSKILLRRGILKGGAPVEAEIAARIENRKVRVDSLKGRALGGDIAGNGAYDADSGAVEGKFSLRRMAFGTAPWKEWGFAFRPAGAGDAEIVLSGVLGRVRAEFSWKNPGGLERTSVGKGAPEAIRLPLFASATGEYVHGVGLTVPEFRLRAGLAEVSGGGEISIPSRHLRFGGKLSAPRGRTSEYGWDVPVSWESVSGEWKVEGEAASPRVTVRLETKDLSPRGLPPVPVVVKMDGNPTDVFHFVADIPSKFARATATGTFTGPFSGKPFLVEASIGAREIDFAEGSRWITDVMAVLGKEPSGAARWISGMGGSGSGDVQVSVGKDALSIEGTLRSDEFRIAGIDVRDVSAEGEWNRTGTEESWKVAARGKTKGEGELLLKGEGSDASAAVTGTVGRLDLGSALLPLGSGFLPRIRGTAALRFSSRYAGHGWVMDSFSASVPMLSVDNVVLEDVSVEGSLGLASGRFEIASGRPGMKLVAQVGRGDEWPVAFRFAAADVPTEFLLSAAGRPEIASTGAWNAGAEGILKAATIVSGKTFPPESIAALHFSASASSATVSGLEFGESRVEGKKDGNVLVGEIVSRSPESRLAFSVTLRDPFGFRLEGPLSVVTAGGKGQDEGKKKFSLDGRVEVAGALRALSGATGVLRVHQFSYLGGGLDLSGKEISARLLPEGIRWTGGTILAAGNPLRVSGKTSWDGDLDLHVGGSIPAAAIRLVTDVFDRLGGTMHMDLRLTGKWSDPVFVGTGRLDGGYFSFRGYSQLFEEMQADAIISREKILFEHFEGRSGGGYVDGRGELPLRFDAHQRLFFSVDFFDMRFPYPEEFRPVLEGHVELLGPYDDFLVTGEVEVQDARYTKPIRLEKLPIDFRKRLVDVTARREKADFRVRLDVNGVADGTIRIKNNLADASAKGEFKVVGDVSGVIVLGAFDVVEGTVEYQGNKYELKRVSVDFQDPRRNNPRLDARAETKKGDVTVTVSVTGTLDKYEVDMSSDPPLSKNDIVSLLSLGVTAGELAGSEGTVSAAAASSIVLGPYKGKVEEGIRGIVQLDKFAIEPSFSTSTKTFEPKFIVGKSFGDRFSVSVSSSVGTSSESSAIAEYKLLENVFLQGAWESATTDREGDLGADVKVRYRYRRFKDFLRGRE